MQGAAFPFLILPAFSLFIKSLQNYAKTAQALLVRKELLLFLTNGTFSFLYDHIWDIRNGLYTNPYMNRSQGIFYRVVHSWR